LGRPGKTVAAWERILGKRRVKSKSSPKGQPTPRWSKVLIPGLLAVAVATGAGTWFFLQRSSPQVVAAEYTGGARLAVDKDFIDFGNVRFEKFVTANFRLRNIGNQPLRLAVDRTVEAIEGC
jgi:hypothetical protein